MFVFNTRIISSSGGRNGDNADLSLAELKTIMKNLIIHERPQQTQTAVWATDLNKTIKTTNRAGVAPLGSPSGSHAATQTTGGRVWAYKPSQKKKSSVKSFAI